MMRRYQSLAFYGGRAFIPTMGKAPSGLLWEVEPVTVLTPERQALAAVFGHRLVVEPKAVKDWSRGDPPGKSVVQVAAKCRSWIAFARGSLRFALIESDESWQVSVSEGPTPDDVENRYLPAASGPEELASAVMDVAQKRTIWA
jgi:hypothetical protein